MRQIRIIVERHSNRFVAYALGVPGGKATYGSTYEEALARLSRSADVYPKSLAADLVAMRPPVLEACVLEGGNGGALRADLAARE
jgi:hypothetical protein